MKWLTIFIVLALLGGGIIVVHRHRVNTWQMPPTTSPETVHPTTPPKTVPPTTPPTKIPPTMPPTPMPPTTPPAPSGSNGSKVISPASGNYDKSLTWGGLKRTYMVHLPTGYDISKEYPLLVVLHGGFGTAKSMESSTGLSLVSDANGFIVVYPEGTTGVTGVSSWNAGGCCSQAVTKNIDDVGFIRQVVATLKSTYRITNGRIFVTGMSNGAMLTNRLACEAADIFSGAAAVSGTIQVDTCKPAHTIPFLMVHGTNDGSVPYTGGKGTGSGTANSTFLPVEQALADWANRNKCSSSPTTTAISPLVQDGITIDKIVYGSCSASTLMYRINGGVHSWPGGTSDTSTKAFNASDAIWKFFSSI